MTDTSLLQGEVTENPAAHDLDVESLLRRFLAALLEEQRADLEEEPPAKPKLLYKRLRAQLAIDRVRGAK